MFLPGPRNFKNLRLLYLLLTYFLTYTVLLTPLRECRRSPARSRPASGVSRRSPRAIGATLSAVSASAAAAAARAAAVVGADVNHGADADNDAPVAGAFHRRRITALSSFVRYVRPMFCTNNSAISAIGTSQRRTRNCLSEMT